MKFDISTVADAANATKQAAIAGAISGGLTLILAGFAMANGGSLLDGFITSWTGLDAAVMLGLAYGVYLKSRASAVGLLAYYLLNQILLRAEMGWDAGLGMSVFFVFFFVQGVRGAFAYHRMTSETEPPPTGGVVQEAV